MVQKKSAMMKVLMLQNSAVHDIRAVMAEPTNIWLDTVHNRTLWLSEQTDVDFR